MIEDENHEKSLTYEPVLMRRNMCLKFAIDNSIKVSIMDHTFHKTKSSELSMHVNLYEEFEY